MTPLPRIVANRYENMDRLMREQHLTGHISIKVSYDRGVPRNWNVQLGETGRIDILAVST